MVLHHIDSQTIEKLPAVITVIAKAPSLLCPNDGLREDKEARPQPPRSVMHFLKPPLTSLYNQMIAPSQSLLDLPSKTMDWK